MKRKHALSSVEMIGKGWTINGPKLEAVDGEEAWVIRIDEFPGFLVVEDSREAAIAELHPAMKAWLDGLIDSGLELPKPRSPLSITLVSGERVRTVPALLGRDLGAEVAGQSTRGSIGMQPA